MITSLEFSIAEKKPCYNGAPIKAYFNLVNLNPVDGKDSSTWLPMWPHKTNQGLQPYDTIQGYTYPLVVVAERVVEVSQGHYCSCCGKKYRDYLFNMVEIHLKSMDDCDWGSLLVVFI